MCCQPIRPEMLSVCAAVALPTPHLPCVSSIHASHVGRCHCDCVLVDVGLNNGDSLLSWPKAALASAQDHGEADAPVWRRLHSCMASSAACYYGFEANPDFSGRLEALEAQLREDGRPVRLFTETAFSTSSEGADVFVEPTPHRVCTGGCTAASGWSTSPLQQRVTM